MSEQYWDPTFGAVTKIKDNTVWIWDFLGDNSLIIKIPYEVSFGKRFRTKILLGSKWKRVKKSS